MVRPNSGAGGTCGEATTTHEVNREDIATEALKRREYIILHRTYRRLENEAQEAGIKNARCWELRRQLLSSNRERKELIMLASNVKENNGRKCQNKFPVADLLTTYRHHKRLVGDLEKALKQSDMVVIYIMRAANELAKKKNFKKRRCDLVMNPEALAKKRDHLETNLERYSKKLNWTYVINARILQEILDMLIERGLFFQQHQELRQKLHRVKSKMHAVVAKSHTCYDIHDTCRDQERRVQKMVTEECRLFHYEIQESVRVVKHNKKIGKFVIIKGRARQYFEDETGRVKRRKEAAFTKILQLIPVYERVFESLLAGSGFTTLDEMVQSYRERDEENKSLCFNVQNMALVNGYVEKDILELRKKIEKVELDQAQRKRDRQQALVQLKAEFFECKNELDLQTMQLSKTMETVDKLVKQVEGLSHKVAGRNEPSVYKLGMEKNFHIEHKTYIPIFLQDVQFRIEALLMRADVLTGILTRKPGQKQKRNTAGLNPFGLERNYSNIVAAGGFVKPKITLPASLYSQEDEEEEKTFAKRPLTHDEFKVLCRQPAHSSTHLLQAINRPDARDILDYSHTFR